MGGWRIFIACTNQLVTTHNCDPFINLYSYIFISTVLRIQLRGFYHLFFKNNIPDSR